MGEAFLSVIRDHARSRNLEEREKPSKGPDGKRRDHANAYERWSSDDDQELKAMFSSGTGVSELARHFGRNQGEIRSRLKKLDLMNEAPVGSTYDRTKQLLLQGMTIEEIAQERGLRRSRIVKHLERLILSGEKIDLRPLLPSPERVERIREAVEQSGGNYLSPVKEILGDDYSYDEIRLVWLLIGQWAGKSQKPVR